MPLKTREQKAKALRVPLDRILPAGKTCGGCAHHHETCKGLFNCNESNDYCDWSPSRFEELEAKEHGS